ncbi:hypothetical protein CBS101457_002331 [Exobasidium rhododendri]|nr:hypothetical protein CBS101457_002331 [Exobasidium rhododendri]
MSVSPSKPKRRGQDPEVIIDCNRRSLMKRSRSSKSPPKVSLEAVDIYAGLSRIEQIRLRAKLKAEEEERREQAQEEEKRSSRRSGSRNLLVDADDNDDDDDDELPSICTSTSRISSSLSSAPRKSSQSVDRDFLPSSSYDREGSSHTEPDDSPPTAFTQRSRRKAARLEPYIFRPSLDPLSERRQKLEIAKESAAVQAKLMKREDFKLSNHPGRSDIIERILREQRRERKKGLDIEGLDATIRLMQETSSLIKEADKRIESSRAIVEGSRVVKTDAEDDDASSDDASTSSSSDLEHRRPVLTGGKGVNVSGARLETDKERDEQMLAVLLGDDSADEEFGQEAFDILVKDKTDTKRNKMGELEDAGLEERSFWVKGKVPRARKWHSAGAA